MQKQTQPGGCALFIYNKRNALRSKPRVRQTCIRAIIIVTVRRGGSTMPRISRLDRSEVCPELRARLRQVPPRPRQRPVLLPHARAPPGDFPHGHRAHGRRPQNRHAPHQAQRARRRPHLAAQLHGLLPRQPHRHLSLVSAGHPSTSKPSRPGAIARSSAKPRKKPSTSPRSMTLDSLHLHRRRHGPPPPLLLRRRSRRAHGRHRPLQLLQPLQQSPADGTHQARHRRRTRPGRHRTCHRLTRHHGYNSTAMLYARKRLLLRHLHKRPPLPG